MTDETEGQTPRMGSEEPTPFDVKSMVFYCCFCDEEMGRKDIWTVVLIDPNDEEQTWWCHRDCFADKLHPDYRMLRDEDEFELDAELQRVTPLTAQEMLDSVMRGPAVSPPIVPPAVDEDEYKARRMRVYKDGDE